LGKLPEFRRDALEALRQPLGDGIVTSARIRATFAYPACFTLAAARLRDVPGLHSPNRLERGRSAIVVHRTGR
jgi:predicted ATPase with chaperone activity